MYFITLLIISVNLLSYSHILGEYFKIYSFTLNYDYKSGGVFILGV